MQLIKFPAVIALALVQFSPLAISAKEPASSKAEAPSSDHRAPTFDPKKSPHFLISVDYLCWKTFLSGLEVDFGNSNITYSTVDAFTTTESKEYDRDPIFHWASGVRLAWNSKFDCDNLELNVGWTHLANRGHVTSHGEDDIVNAGSCKISLNQIDISLTRQYGGCSSNVRPFIGLRGSRIHEKVRSQLTSNITVLPDTQAIETRALHDKQWFNGIGPTLGFSGNLEFRRGFGMYGLAGFGLIYGNYQVDFNDTDFYSAPFSQEYIILQRQHLNRFNFNLDLGVGLFWDTCFDNAEVHLKLALEYHGYFNQSYLSVYPGDLSFIGGVVSLGIPF